MVRFLFTLFICSGIIAGNIHAATVPSPGTGITPSPAARQIQSVLRLTVHDIEKLSGRKMNFKEKVRFRLAKISHKLIPGAFEEGVPTAKQIKQGRLSLIFGLSGVFLFLMGFIVPGIVFLSLPLGIAALVLGIKSVKGNGNTQGVVGIVSGASLILMWLLLALIIAVFISSGGFWG